MFDLDGGVLSGPRKVAIGGAGDCKSSLNPEVFEAGTLNTLQVLNDNEKMFF